MSETPLYDEAIMCDLLGRSAERRLGTFAVSVIDLARKYAHPGANPGAHQLASEILRLAGEREEGR